MANPHRGEATLRDGETEYRLRFHWNAAAEYEEVTGQTLSEALANVARRRVSAKAVRAMLWAGLREHHPEVTLAQAGQIIDHVGRTEANRVLGVALRYYFPELEDEGPPADPQPPAPSQ
jgi:hypothetical protein